MSRYEQKEIVSDQYYLCLSWVWIQWYIKKHLKNKLVNLLLGRGHYQHIRKFVESVLYSFNTKHVFHIRKHKKICILLFLQYSVLKHLSCKFCYENLNLIMTESYSWIYIKKIFKKKHKKSFLFKFSYLIFSQGVL